MRVRNLAVGLLAGALTIGGAPAAAPAPATPAAPVALVVGLRRDAAPVAALDLIDAVRVTDLSDAVVVDVPAGAAAAATRALRADPNVAYVEPDHIAHAAVIRPADPGYAGQWGIGLTRVNQAWSATRGAARVTVAVVDTGVSRLPDLAARMLAGHDFANADENATDDNGHGTMAASVIAATGGNRTGIAGICWYCTILPVKVLGRDGSGSYSHIAEGIRYAADRGATVISVSLGGSEDSRLLRDAVAYAVARGALVVAAAGNQGSAEPHYPAAIASVVAVGGVAPTGARYPWSNYGRWVDLVAPGCNPAQDLSGAVAEFCGTSSATPFVAGVAGLFASTEPAPGAAAVRSALLGGAVRGRVDALGGLAALPVAGDTTRPALVFGATPKLARGPVTITAAAADQRGVARVRLYAAGRLIGTDTVPPYAFRWQSAPRTGALPLELRAYDRAGNVAVLRRYVRADNTPPAVRVDRRGRYVTARATDASGVARVELLVNDRVIARHAGYLRQFRMPATTRTVLVRAYDKAGNARVVVARAARR
jgi:subtilisin family serine protease